METQKQIDHLIELAIEQRGELARIVGELPQIRTELRHEIALTLEEVEPQLRSDLEEFCVQRATDANAKVGAALEAKIAELAKALEATTQARYNAIRNEAKRIEEIRELAEKKIEGHVSTLPDAVKDLVGAELARFPRAGEIDQLRKEFAEPRGLNPRGKWQSGETYQKLDLVSYNGDSFVSSVNDNREKPGRSSKTWTLSAARGIGGTGGGATSINEMIGPPGANQIIGSEGGNYVPKTLTAGTNVTITETPTEIIIDSSGGGGGSGTVTRVAATGDGNVTVSGSPITTSGTFALALASTSVTAGSYGAAGKVGTFTVDAKGRLTAAADIGISITTGQISDGVVKSLFTQQGVITSLSYAQFDTTSSVTPGVGKLTWDTTNGTLDLGLAGGNVNTLVGIDQHILAYNPTGSPLTKGQVVIADGSSGTRLAVDLALGDADANTAETLGLVAESISNNQSGFVLTKGLMRGVNTNAFNEGDVLWVSSVTAGAITNVRPTAPNHAVRVGYCIKKAGIADGIIYVDPLNGFELGELHDVAITGVANNNFLVYDGTDTRWENYTDAQARTALGLGSAALQATTYFAPATTGTSILAGNGSGGFASVTVGTGLTYVSGTLSATGGGGSGGTVTSVALTAGVGISISGGPITTSGTIEVTNTAPDQTVSLTGAGTTSITGTYPNFTITSADQYTGTVTSVSLTAGTGISVSGGPITTTGTIQVINTAPDQTVTLTPGGTTSITGTYPNFTISSADQFTGTVTSVALTAGTGISISGGPVTSSGTIEVINSAPDQIVALTGSGTTSITGTYPNFTISSADQYSGTVTSVALTAGTGISISGGPVTSSGTIEVINSAPDQTVVLTQGGTTTITGTYPNFTISSADQYVGTVTSVALTAGTGISISGGPVTSSGTIEVINSAPDQTVVLTGTGTTTVTGTYPNFTINSADQYVGTVTSVTAQGSADISVTGGPITTSGTLYFSLADTTVAAGNYGSAGAVPSITVDAKGRITAASTVSISITTGQVTGLGTIATQAASNVTISGGSIDGTAIGSTTASSGRFTSLTATGNVSFDGGSFVFNDSGAVLDFRIEGDTKTHLLFTSATVDRVGINQSSPATRLDIDGNFGQNIVAVSALDVDCATGNYFTKTIAANSTFTFSNAPASRSYAFTLEVTHTSGTITWPAAVKWPGGTAPTLTTGKTHLFMFVTDDGGTTWRGASLINYTN